MACRRSPWPASGWAWARWRSAVLGAVGVVPLEFRTADVVVAGQSLPWWAAIGELALVAAAFAYLLGTYAVRALGATVASFVGLSEVLFAILFAWLLLGELPGIVQLLGGVVVVAGVVAVRLGERAAPTGIASGAADEALAGTSRARLASVHTGPMPQQFKPVPRVGVVTGASQGIGAAIAEGLADAGWTVDAVARGRRALSRLADSRPAGRIVPAPADLTDDHDVAELVDLV